MFEIGDRAVGAGESTFIIAETGSNHNGEFNLATNLIDAGDDAVKFQTFRGEEMYVEESGEFGCDHATFINAMNAENIGVQMHYVLLYYHLYFQKEYGYERGQFPVTEQVYDESVSLFLFPEMEPTDVADVIRTLERLRKSVSRER